MKLAFDIGATSMRVAELTDTGVGEIVRVYTPQDLEAALAVFKVAVKKFGGGAVESAVGGVAAIVTAGTIEYSTNLPSWTGFAFEEKLSHVLSAPVQLINDAELAALGEASFGSGKGYGRVGYLGIGTGIGTALVHNGAIEAHSSDGIARISILTLPDGKNLEEVLGGRSLQARYHKPPAELDRVVWTALTPSLAQSLGTMQRLWDTDVIVLGGSLMNELNGFGIREVHRALSDSSILLLRSAFGDSSALNGARALEAK